MLVGAMMSIKSIPGVVRPSIASLIPKLNGGYGIILDVGANADCRPDSLVQFAILGSMYATEILGIENPKVGLLSIGEEDEKGNLTTLAANNLFRDNESINFYGNIEGRDLFNDKVDVIVCDGFVGNIVLKMAESFYDLVKNRKIEDEFFNEFNYEKYGGSPILGLNKPVIIGHGISNDIAIKNMIAHAIELAKSGIEEKIQAAFN
jgi:glycerol-3-phosphate acyltransferase PlsX